MKLTRLFLFMGFISMTLHSLFAQNSVGIGTESPNPNAVLQLVSPTNDQGFLIPVMTTAQRSTFAGNLTATEAGLMVFDSTDLTFYYWANNSWSALSTQQLTAGTGITIDGSFQINNTGDLDIANEIQDLDLTGNILTITNNSTATSIDLSSYLDNTDNQNLDFTSGQISLSGDPDATIIDLSAYDTNAADDFDGSYLNLTDIPADIADGDDNTQLSEAEVDAFIANDGYLLSESDPTVPAAIKDGIDWSEVSGIPSDIADGDSDNQTISFATTSLTISGGNTVDLAGLQDGYEPNTDAQDLTLSGNTLSLTNDGTPVDLTGYLDNTDNQTASQVNLSAAITGMTATNVQDGLQEHQTDITSINSSNSTQNSRLNALEAGTTDFHKILGRDFERIPDGQSLTTVNYGTDGLSISFSSLEGLLNGQLIVPVNLPNGAVVTYFEAYMDDLNNAAKLDFTYIPLGANPVETTPISLATATGATGTFVRISTNTEINIVNDSELYFLQFSVDADSASGGDVIYYVNIQYQY